MPKGDWIVETAKGEKKRLPESWAVNITGDFCHFGVPGEVEGVAVRVTGAAFHRPVAVYRDSGDVEDLS